MQGKKDLWTLSSSGGAGAGEHRYVGEEPEEDRWGLKLFACQKQMLTGYALLCRLPVPFETEASFPPC